VVRAPTLSSAVLLPVAFALACSIQFVPEMTNPLFTRFVGIPVPRLHDVAGGSPGPALAAIAVAGAVVFFAERRRGRRILRAIALACVIGLLGVGSYRIVRPLAHLPSQSATEELHRELTARVARGRRSSSRFRCRRASGASTSSSSGRTT
jgi:hypothetical protein